MLGTLVCLLQISATILAAKSLGKLLLRKRTAIPERGLRAAFETGLGLLLISYIIFALAQVQAVSPAVLWGLLTALAGLSLYGVLGREPVRVDRKYRAAAIGFGVLWFAWAFANSLLPPLGIDELVYHLAVPEDLLDASGQIFFKDNVYAYFPQLLDMLFVWGLGLGGEGAARSFHILYAFLTGLAIYSFTRSYVSSGYAYLGGLLYLTIPTVLVIAPWAYVDLGFTFYAFLAFTALLRYLESRSLSWIWLAGLMAGAAWATKYTGMQYLLLLLLILLLHRLRSSDQSVPWDAALFPAIGFLTVLPYLLRNWILTGWPLYPFNMGFFSLNPEINWDGERSRLFLQWLGQFGGMSEHTLIDKLLAPVMVFLTARLGDLKVYDGMLGYAFLLIPFLFLKGKRPRNFWVFLSLSVGFLYYWAFTTQQVRFLLPILPVLVFLLVFGLAQQNSKALNAVVVACVAVSLFLGLDFQLKFRPQDYWFGLESREEFLARRVVGAPVYQEASRLSDEDRVLLVNMGNFTYLLDVPWRSDFVFEYYRLGKELEQAESAADLEGFFRRMQISHLMMNEGVTLSAGALPERERRILEDFLESRTELLFRSPVDPTQTLRKLTFPTGR